MKVKAIGNLGAKEELKFLEIERRKTGPTDVLIKISHCGICHSDIHTARSEWGPTFYPCVPGHEIVGQVLEVGKKVRKFKVGDEVGVGCLVDSCGKCANCKKHEQQFCLRRPTYTYNSPEPSGKGHTLGGYASHITVKQDYVLKLKKGLPLERIAPLLCAGITTYSPLKRYKVKKGTRVGVVGLGGLGHMAIKIAKAMGAEVVVFSTSPSKQQDAKKLGAKHFVNSKEEHAFQAWMNQLDLIINTVSAPIDFTPYMMTLKNDATMVLVGVSPTPNQIAAFSLIGGRKKLTGSLIGGIKETQEMLNFCIKKKVFADVEVISPDLVNQAYERTIKSDVKYRFVIDAKTLV